MYSANFSKDDNKILKKRLYQNLSHNNVGKTFLEVYNEMDSTPINKVKRNTINKSISKT